MNYYPQMMQQQNGFMLAPNEVYVLNYPIGLGHNMTFKIDGQPIVIEKYRSMSQFDSPRLERYRLVKEEEQEDTFDIKAEIKNIWDAINNLETKKREVRNDTKQRSGNSE